MAPTLILGLINTEGSEKNLNDLKILNKDQSKNSKLRTSVPFSKKDTDKTIETVFLEPDANFVANSELQSPEFKPKEIIPKTKAKSKYKKPAEVPSDVVEQAEEEPIKKPKKNRKEESHLTEMIAAL